MVIIVPSPISGETRVEMYDALFKMLGFVLPFVAPQLLMIGTALLVYDFWTVGAGVGFVIAGSIVMIITILVLVFSERNHRRRKTRFLKIPILVGISIFGLFEFIAGLILTDGISRYDGLGLVIRLMTVGAGSIIAFPALIYLIIVIVETILGKNSIKSPKPQISPVSGSPALSSEVRRSIHLLFEHEYDEIEATLTTMLTEGIVDKKLIILSELGKLKNKKSSTLVLNALEDENKYVRRRAAEALGKIGVTQHIEPMNIIAQEETDPETKARIKKAIAVLELTRSEENEIKKVQQTCGSCGQENQENLSFCSSCGGKMSD